MYDIFPARAPMKQAGVTYTFIVSGANLNALGPLPSLNIDFVCSSGTRTATNVQATATYVTGTIPVAPAGAPFDFVC